MKFLIIILLIIFVFRFRHTKIKFKTFFKKGFAPKRGRFGVYCYCGKQGSGKTYSVVEFLKQQKDIPIYSNISTLKGIKYTYFNGFDNLLKLRDEHDCVIVYDEIFTALTKSLYQPPKFPVMSPLSSRVTFLKNKYSKLY